MKIINGKMTNKWGIEYDNISDYNINANVVIEVTSREYDFKRLVRYEKRKIRNGWRSGDLIYWKRNQFEYNNIAIDQIKEYTEV